MGDIVAGDQVFDETGNPCNVVAVSETNYVPDCYRIVLSDGSELVADGDHRWVVDDLRAGESRTLETREMVGLENQGSRGKHEGRFRLPRVGPLVTDEIELEVSPYVLGYWLGDGSSHDAAIACGMQDHDDAVMHIEAEGLLTKSVPRADGRNWTIRLYTHACEYGKTNYVRRCFRNDLDVLGNKHIPVKYLRASFNQRLSLMQGLMDSDGTVTVAGTNRRSRRCEFSVVDERLASDFLELARSLGIRATFKSGDAKLNGRVVGTRYRIGFVTELPVFRLSRKAERHAEQELPLRRRSRTIRSIERIPTVPTRCIQVDSP
ncbi:MAG: LAGLIDADG family homing endonuclease, partial [Pseudomonadota bacterium]